VASGSTVERQVSASRRCAKAAPRRSRSSPCDGRSNLSSEHDALLLARLSTGAEELLGAISEFLLRAGMQRSAVSRALMASARKVSSGHEIGGWYGGAGEFGELLGQAFELWWTDPRFLDRAARPLNLRTTGRESVSALLRERLPARQVRYGLDVLRGSPSVHVDENGTWTARERALILTPHAHLSFERLVGLVRGLLSTFHTNNSGQRPGLGLLERTAFSGNLPRDFVPTFARAVHEHLGESLFGILQLLRNAESRRGPRSDTEVGVEVYMYELPKRGTSRYGHNQPTPSPGRLAAPPSPRRVSSSPRSSRPSAARPRTRAAAAAAPSARGGP
jgi:hypothetical protein